MNLVGVWKEDSFVVGVGVVVLEILSRIPERIAVPRVPEPRTVRVIGCFAELAVPFGTWGVVILVVVVVIVRGEL